MIKFRLVNVFTREGGGALSGNPLCVFESGVDLDTATMQALALQFNLSETTFLLPSQSAAARVRIFTPTFEMPFAGHPALGSAHVCRALGLGGDSMKLEMQSGEIPLEATGNRWTLRPPDSTWRDFESPLGALADALGLQPQDLAEGPLWVKSGSEQLIVPLRSADAVRRASPRPEAFVACRNASGQSMAYVFASTGEDTVLSRFFFTQTGSVREDPATGSATANFGAWCLAMNRPLPIRLRISQGEYCGRPSTLYLEVDSKRRIFVGGDVVEIGAGAITSL